ncbi:MAG: aminoacyl-tRNA hydrolase [Patescibacteria group bacterium]
MSQMKDINLIIGLGNPSQEYEKTFHNMGHLFVDESFKFKVSSLKFLKTDCFMNKSGEFVKEILKKEKLKPDNLLVIHDDSDIELGKFKFSFGRNSAGHKGAQNIIDQLKTKNFWRLRIGIRPSFAKATEGQARPKADKLVLKKISSTQMEVLEKVFKEAAKQL